jgi:hypothetical protein
MTSEIIVYRLDENKEIFKIVPSTLPRNWMDASTKKFAYKCLPLNIANQYGWTVLSPIDFSISWYGGDDPSDVDISVSDLVSREDSGFDTSVFNYFGNGVFTVHLDFILKTPEGFSTYIRGIPNEPKVGVKYLDAIVETDWLPLPFTYNIKVVEPGTYHFKKGEPLFVFFPIERGTVENFKLINKSIKDDQEFYQDFVDYEDSRAEFQSTPGNALKFQRFYFNGTGPKKTYSIKNHFKKLLFGSENGTIK